MTNRQAAEQVRAHAEYLRKTYLPIGEKAAIERVLSCAASLEKLAKEMETDEADHQQERA